MPTYNYRCKTCDTRFDWVQPMSEDALTVCPAEGGPAACAEPGKGEVTKVFGAVGITFKGSGFYKTDSRSGSKSAAGNGSSGDSSKESASSGSGSGSDGGSTDSSSKESASSGSGSSSSSSGSSSSPSGSSSSSSGSGSSSS